MGDQKKRRESVPASAGLDTKTMTAQAVRMAWPAVLESFFVSFAGMIDTMMVSTLGSAAVAAVGLTVQPKFIGLAAFFAVNMAVSALVARRKGEGRQKEANETLVTALWIVLVLCAVVTALCLWGAEPILRFAGSAQETHEPAVAYFRIIMGGTVFTAVQMLFNSAQRGSGNTRISMTTNVTSSIVNICCNYLLIGGHFGFPALGVRGAAIATVLGSVVGAGMSIASLFRRTSYVSVSLILREKVRFTARVFRSIVSFSSNVLAENLAMRVGFLATAFLAARLGTDAFAAHNVGMNLMGLAFSFADGMQAAGVALAGEALGAKEKEKAKRYGSICQKIGLGISAVLALVMFFGGRAIYSLYFQEPHILEYGVLITRFIMVIVPLQISQIIYGACLRAAGDIRYTLVASLISVMVIRTLSTYVLTSVLGLGLAGIWLGVLSDQLMRYLFMSTRFRRGKWVDLKL
ncbi:MAG: MATE family efflux transporter [Eubacteriales bacterium]|nr:MATE family efflux transporter [Eubacteriales bacterium]